MNIELRPQAIEDLSGSAAHDTRLLKRALKLIEAARRAPFEGLGKPEPLRGELAGWWSRRIDSRHRLVYRVTGEPERLQVVQARYHY
ncbi:Txe/YoeB family addiction module toxin [Maricaulis sp.]|uniref:Txe/YoeB family addiction module toxin n=1 Tax=Maricaulis sp. TaxID=1486257 RepID=UPI003A8FF697